MGVFNRDFLKANGSGKSNKSNGGNGWIYRSGDVTDTIAVLRAAPFFVPFASGFEVGDIIDLVPGNVSNSYSKEQITVVNNTTVTLVAMTLAA